MKRIFYLLAFTIISTISQAQITQIVSLPGGLAFGTTDVDKYYTSQSNDNTIKLYNWNGSLYKSIHVTPPTGYTIFTVYYPSKKYINNDEKLEMIVCFIKTEISVSNTNYSMWLINEDGTKLHDFGYAYHWGVYFDIFNGELHLRTLKALIDANNQTSYTTILYRCSGSGSVNIAQQNGIDLGPVFPNPATNIITLPYQLKNKATSQINIYDASGHLYTAIPVGSHFNEIKIDVSNYPSGIYIYECEGISNKFIVQ